MADIPARIVELFRSRRDLGADDHGAWADWFDARADVFDAIAQEFPTLADEAAGLAQGAREQARTYRRGDGRG